MEGVTDVYRGQLGRKLNDVFVPGQILQKAFFR